MALHRIANEFVGKCHERSEQEERLCTYLVPIADISTPPTLISVSMPHISVAQLEEPPNEHTDIAAVIILSSRI
jgi:hypothetical protein